MRQGEKLTPCVCRSALFEPMIRNTLVTSTSAWEERTQIVTATAPGAPAPARRFRQSFDRASADRARRPASQPYPDHEPRQDEREKQRHHELHVDAARGGIDAGPSRGGDRVRD